MTIEIIGTDGASKKTKALLCQESSCKPTT